MDKNYLNAATARAMSEMSLSLKNHVYKAIKDEASDNREVLLWDIENCNTVAVDSLIRDLEHDGYTVERLETDTFLKITW